MLPSLALSSILIPNPIYFIFKFCVADRFKTVAPPIETPCKIKLVFGSFLIASSIQYFKSFASFAPSEI